MYLPSSLSAINILEPEIEPAYEASLKTKSSIKESPSLLKEDTVSSIHLCDEPTVVVADETLVTLNDHESEIGGDESVDHIENSKFNAYIER